MDREVRNVKQYVCSNVSLSIYTIVNLYLLELQSIGMPNNICSIPSTKKYTPFCRVIVQLCVSMSLCRNRKHEKYDLITSKSYVWVA